MAHQTRLETLFETNADRPVTYNKPRSLPSRTTQTKHYPTLGKNYGQTIATIHEHSVVDTLPASTKYLDLPQPRRQPSHARQPSSSPSATVVSKATTSLTSSTSTTPTVPEMSQKFSLAQFWNRHMFLTSSPSSSSAPTPPPSTSPSPPPQPQHTSCTSSSSCSSSSSSSSSVHNNACLQTIDPCGPSGVTAAAIPSAAMIPSTHPHIIHTQHQHPSQKHNRTQQQQQEQQQQQQVHQQQHRHEKSASSTLNPSSCTSLPHSSTLSHPGPSSTSTSTSTSTSISFASSTLCVPPSGTNTLSKTSSSSSSTSTSTPSSTFSNMVLGTLSKRTASKTGLSLSLTTPQTKVASPSLASAPVPLQSGTHHGSELLQQQHHHQQQQQQQQHQQHPMTRSMVGNTFKTVPMGRSQTHSAVMTARRSTPLTASLTTKRTMSQHRGNSDSCVDSEYYSYSVIDRDRDRQHHQQIQTQTQTQQHQQHQHQYQQQQIPENQQQQQQEERRHEPKEHSQIQAIKKRVAHGQSQLEHYARMLEKLDEQGQEFLQRQQQLREQREEMARQIESLEEVLHRPWQKESPASPFSPRTGTASGTVAAVAAAAATAAATMLAGRRKSLPSILSHANHASERQGREEGGSGVGLGGEAGGLFVLTQIHASKSDAATTTKGGRDRDRDRERERGAGVGGVVLHSHKVGDAEKDDTDDVVMDMVDSSVDGAGSASSSGSDSSSFSDRWLGSRPVLAIVSPPPSSCSPTWTPSSSSHNLGSNVLTTSSMTRPTLASPSSAKEDSVVSFKADCERCVLKKELQHKRATLQMLQGEIERVQQRLNSGASQARMIQRTFIGPIEQHLAMDRVELGQFERAMIRSI